MIKLRKVAVHNLKKVDLELTPNQLIVFTGVSGSGKSSLAFDTIYVEGQRRYIESLSTFARRHLGDLTRPEAEHISGISPTIAIEQKTAGRNPRSTVGTMTGIYDFLRVLFARIGIPHCPVSGQRVTPQSSEEILRTIEEMGEGSKLVILAPLAREKKGEFKEEFAELLRKGFMRVRLDGKIIELTEEVAIDGKVAHTVEIVIDRIALEASERGRLAEAVTGALEAGEGVMSVVEQGSGRELLFSQHAYSPKSGLSYGPLEPQDFSFNHPSGMCPTCQGLGNLLEFDLEKIIDPEKSISEGCCSIGSSYQTVRFGNIYDNLAALYDFDIDSPWKTLPKKAQDLFLHGTRKKWTKMQFTHPTKGQSWTEYVKWRGVLHEARTRYQEATSDLYRNKMEELMESSLCPDCKGGKIRAYPAATKLHAKTLFDLTQLPLSETLAFFNSLKLTKREGVIAEELIKEISERLSFLLSVGLHYLSLERTAPTLSGGEAQRVRLASQIGAGLSKATYVLDEPSIGLHPRDNTKLLVSLEALRDKGNTVIVVEHDEATILAADHIVDVGPLAGKNGGEILVSGSLQELLDERRSLTGDYLSGRKAIAIPKKRRKGSKKAITIEGATHHNLKNITAKIPLEMFVAVTGVSGSGKSSLISDILHPALAAELHHAKEKPGSHKAIKGIEHIDKVIAIDQTPIGRTPRSNPATYIKLFDLIRDLYALLPESQAAGFKPGRFSFNVKEGSCLQCGGVGMEKIDMDFMEDEWTTCKLCKGRRFDERTLSIKYRGKSIYDVLEMPISEAALFFEPIPKIRQKLDLLLKVGLEYIPLGQSSPTLSGGEAQRIKLAKELSRPATGRTLYILDEPTTGLHFHDIDKLLGVLSALVDRKNSVLVIEHNMDLVKTADWVIDLGPEGGAGGGEIVATGTPEQVAKMESPTSRAIHAALNPKPIKKAPKKQPRDETHTALTVQGAEQNNLRKVSAAIPHGQITVCTGPSGSGKSSFAFETIYAEGQRRYIESMGTYARQFVKQMAKPKVEGMEGLLAAIAIEQKSHAGNPRSTIGTMTEIYDYLRILYAHLGIAYCPETGEEIRSISKEYVLERLMQLPEKTKVQILAPLSLAGSETFDMVKERLLREGFLRLRLNDEIYELDEEIPFDKRRKNTLHLVIDRLMTGESGRKRLFDALELAADIGKGTLVAHYDGKDDFYNLSFAVISTGKSYPPITPHTFSFNTASGMCLDCLGLGFQHGANLEKHPPIMRLSARGLMKKLWKDYGTGFAFALFERFLDDHEIDADGALYDLKPQDLQRLLGGGEWLSEKGYTFRFIGLNALFAKLAKGKGKDEILPWVDQITCPSCRGARLSPLARNVRLQELSISELCALSIHDALEKLQTIDLHKNSHSFLEETLVQVRHRLHFLKAIGIDYLSLDRSAPTLSGGETQRIRLARQLGSGLTGCLYVLDEPTVGLHPHNNALLNTALRELSDSGNTLLLVEHDPMTIEMADQILDFGPGAGRHGGELIARGTLAEIKKNKDSLTGAYLSGKKRIPIPEKRRKAKGQLRIEKAHLHNLKNLTIDFPTGVMSCITGVSGCGKSTLMGDLLRPALSQALRKRRPPDELTFRGAHISAISQFSKVVILDQNPIGHTNRADISTYADLLTPLRQFFASLPEAKARGLLPRYFSFNHRKGMCNACWGLGKQRIEMQFLPPVSLTCESCKGYRLNPLSLQVKTRGKHLGHILKMTVEEALAWIAPIPKVVRILETLVQVGLGYLELGQEIATLSGGEAQRLRLARELAKRAQGKTLYLFDEPTIGLHFEDVARLLKIFHALVDKGHTVIIIEHNLDVIASVDHIIDLGPEAGIKGGELIATGTPEEIAKHPSSYTAKYLRNFLAEKD
ncbi:MAG: UvrABC system protein A [Chlamydiae bacterium]|nr:UvrABC system protein A [Chlamydiota bacterium]